MKSNEFDAINNKNTNTQRYQFAFGVIGSAAVAVVVTCDCYACKCCMCKFFFRLHRFPACHTVSRMLVLLLLLWYPSTWPIIVGPAVLYTILDALSFSEKCARYQFFFCVCFFVSRFAHFKANALSRQAKSNETKPNQWGKILDSNHISLDVSRKECSNAFIMNFACWCLPQFQNY